VQIQEDSTASRIQKLT
jgi:hypothetical protein